LRVPHALHVSGRVGFELRAAPGVAEIDRRARVLDAAAARRLWPDPHAADRIGDEPGNVGGGSAPAPVLVSVVAMLIGRHVYRSS
jgi:hypothetical protein